MPSQHILMENISKRSLWQGEGIIPGLVKDVYSGQSEAFGFS